MKEANDFSVEIKNLQVTCEKLFKAVVKVEDDLKLLKLSDTNNDGLREFKQEFEALKKEMQAPRLSKQLVQSIVNDVNITLAHIGELDVYADEILKNKQMFLEALQILENQNRLKERDLHMMSKLTIMYNYIEKQFNMRVILRNELEQLQSKLRSLPN